MKKYIPAFIAVLIVGILTGAVIVKRQSRKLSKSKYNTEYQNTSESSISSPSQAPIILLSQTPSATQESENVTSTTSSLPLTITSPLPDSIVTKAAIQIRGETAPNADIFLSDKETVADASGNFSTTISLEEGENLIIITAIDEVGNSAEAELVVTYEAGE